MPDLVGLSSDDESDNDSDDEIHFLTIDVDSGDESTHTHVPAYFPPTFADTADNIPMPSLVNDSDSDDDDPQDDDPNGGTDDDASDGSLSMPDLVGLSSDDDSDNDSEDDAHFLTMDDDSDDDDSVEYFPLEKDIMSNTHAEVTPSTLQTSQDHTLAQFMITTAELVSGDTVLATGSCMLDTGALQASFISKELLDRCPHLHAMQRPCTVDVHLGDDAASTAVSVSRYVPISVCIPDAQGAPHIAHSVWLLVMPTLATDVIVGLPHLIRNFPQCFASHFMQAIMSTYAAVSPVVSLSHLHVMHKSLQQSNTHPLHCPQPSLAPAGDRTVSVLSLNDNGFNAACTKGLLRYLEQRFESHDVLLLQEVKLAPAKHAKARDALLALGYAHVAINSIAGSSGVLITVRPTLAQPMFTCDIPGCDLVDSRGRVMTMTTSDPPITVVCAYLPFCNPLIDDIAPRCSTFRATFTKYICDLAANSPHRQRSLIIGGDLQVALTDQDESVSLMLPSPGSTDQERID